MSGSGAAGSGSTSAGARVAIVTGASRLAGIGAAIAVALAADGWDLLLIGHDASDRAMGLAAEDNGLEAVAARAASNPAARIAHDAAAQTALGAAARGDSPELAHDDARTAGRQRVRVETLDVDLADPAAAERVVDACHERLGPPSALVNNAAFSARGDLVNVAASDLDRAWAVNARAPILITAAFARRFAGVRGSVVNLTSGQGMGPMPGEIAYAANKGALETFTVQSAAELAPLGIRVNAVDPGATDTGWMSDAQRVELAAPFGRVGTPDDAARLVRFLCSDDARWITGQVLRSRGGA